MLIENKIQIEAIKTREYIAGKSGNTVMISDGRYIVYMPEMDCIIDIEKLKEFPQNGLEKYDPDKLERLLKDVKLTNKSLILSRRMARLLIEKESGKEIWVDNKYLKMFQGCDYYSVDTGDEYKQIVCVRYGKIVGLILPMRVSDED